MLSEVKILDFYSLIMEVQAISYGKEDRQSI